jgi:capsular polysaccharide biosynthesis protein
MFDALPRLQLLKKSGWFDKVDWFVVPRYKHGFQKDTLRLLGIDESKIIEGHQETHIRADNLLAPSFVRHNGHIPKWSCDFLRNHFLPLATAQSHTYSYVYISRNDSSSRNVINESELTSMLDEYGFKKVELGSMSFAEQVSLFASAKVIIGPHGAGLANLVFCKKGTTVIELFAEDYVFPLYYDLANKVELNYDYLICSADAKANNAKQGMKLNLYVDLSKLQTKLDALLETYAVKSMGV